MKQSIFTGSATALITPFSEDGRTLDINAFEKLTAYQISCNTDALVVAGTTGESPVLTKDEKHKLLETAISVASKQIPVIVGTGSNNTEEAVKKSNDAEKKGADGLLIVTPYYNKSTQDGIKEHYFYIADRVSTPIIIYNVPSRTGVNISPETYLELSEHKNIYAVKEANPDISQFMRSISLCGSSLDFYSGNDDLTAVMMSQGAKGVISVAANIIPEVIHKITTLYLSGEHTQAAVLQQKYLELMNILFCEVNPSPIKFAAGKIFGMSDSLRLPLTKINEQNRNRILSVLEKYGLI